jgi:type III pantothenate kinase
MAREHYRLEPLFVSYQLKLNITFDYPKPAEIGADRICNAAAAYDRLGGPTIVVDFGTATTFDIVSDAGAYLGGVIAPGIESSQATLADRAAKLFEISMRKPDSAIGKSTEAAMVAGSYLGAVGQTDRIIEAIAAELGDHPKVLATGGLAGLVGPESRHIAEIDPDITLHGLRLISELNLG